MWDEKICHDYHAKRKKIEERNRIKQSGRNEDIGRNLKLQIPRNVKSRYHQAKKDQRKA